MVISEGQAPFGSQVGDREIATRGAQDWIDMKVILNAAESSGHSPTANLAKAVKLLASIVWHNINQKPPIATDPCYKMARWSLYTMGTGRITYLCPKHMHVLADQWEAKIDKIVLERTGDHLCSYLGSTESHV